MPNIYRSLSPFTARTVYYTIPGIPDLSPDRNQFITDNNGACALTLFGGLTTNLLNSLDPIQTPTLFQFKSDDTSCSGFVANVILAALSINLFSVPNITEFEIFGEIFTQNNVASPNAILGNSEFFGVTYSIANRLASMVNMINNNANLNWRFFAYVVNSSIVIQSKFPGTQYNFNVGTTINYLSSTGGPANFDYNTLSSDNNRGMRYQNYGYKMFLEVWEIDLEWLTIGSDAFPEFDTAPKRLITTLEQNWNPTNIFSFDVSKFITVNKRISLYPSLGPQPPLFVPYTDQQTVLATNTKDKRPIQGYFLRWGEAYQGGFNPNGQTGPLETDPWNIVSTEWTRNIIDTTEVRWASNGMYNLGILVLYNDHPERWLSVSSTGIVNAYPTIKVSQDFIRGKLLPQSQIEKVYKLRRRIDEPEYLAIYVHNDKVSSSTFNMRIFSEWTFIDGSTTTTISHTTIGLSINDLYEANVQLSSVQFDAVETAAGLRVLYWSHTVQISRDTINWTDLSLPVWYQMDLNIECDKYKKLWWIGTEGTTESFEFEGVESMELNFEADYMTKSFNNNIYERQKHINQAITKVPDRQFVLNTGWLTLDQMGFIESILKTPYVWWLNKYRLDFYTNAGSLFPINFTAYEAINIIDSSFKVDNVSKLFNVEIVVQYAINENTSY